MTERQKQWFGYALLVVAIMAVGFLSVRYPLPDASLEERLQLLEARMGIELQAVGPTRFRSIYIDHGATVGGVLTASGGVIGDVTGNVIGNVTGDLIGNVTGDLTGDATISTFLDLAAQTAISVTAAGIITPTGTYQPLTSAAWVTTSTSCAIYTGTVTGRLLILENQNASDIITIDGTGGNVECKADVQLGAGDTLTLEWNGEDWYCLSGYDNS